MGGAASVVDLPSDLKMVDVNGFSKLGVKLSFAQEFIESCGGAEALKGLKTTDVCEQFVLPLTKEHQISFCDYLCAAKHPAVGVAEVFISHAWKYYFLEVIDALQHHFHAKPDVIIWFDLFSNNQHKTSSMEFDWWCNTFKSSIANIGHVVMVLSPWNNPVPLTRAWCLFELYCCITTESKFEIIMPPEQENCFLTDINNNQVTQAVNRMLSLIDCEHSESYYLQDKERIFEVVTKTVGFSAVNALVFERLRQWIIDTAQQDLTRKEQSSGLTHAQTLSALDQLGNLYLDQGSYSQAIECLQKCCTAREEVLGKCHANTIATLNSLGKAYMLQQQYTQAEGYFKDVLERLSKQEEEEHEMDGAVVDRLIVLNNLALVYKNQGNFQLAQPVLIDCYQQKLMLLNPLLSLDEIVKYLSGSNSSSDDSNDVFLNRIDGKLKYDQDLLDILNNLGIVFHALQQHAQAKYFFELNYQQRLIMFTETHPETINAMINLANVYIEEQQYPAAKELLQKAYEFNSTKLGYQHSNTFIALTNLCNVCNQMKEWSTTEQLLLSYLEKRNIDILAASMDKKAFDTSALKMVYLLGNTYLNQQNAKKCEETYVKCYTLQQEILGELHVDTLETMNNLGILYLNTRQLEKANEYLAKCVAYRKHLLGESHPLTQATIALYSKIPADKQVPFTGKLPKLPQTTAATTAGGAKGHHEKLHHKKNEKDANSKRQQHQESDKKSDSVSQHNAKQVTTKSHNNKSSHHH